MDQAREYAEHEAKLARLRAALKEGEESGFIEDFDFDAYIAEMNARHPGSK
jgi:Arc/MetJ-type ribon-helix-helix transcriptional regulator